MLVISPLQELTIAEAAQTPGHILEVGVHRKLTNNLSTCRSLGTDFVLLVAETLGGLAEDTFTPSPTSAELLKTEAVPQTLLPPPSTFGSGLLEVWAMRLPLAPPAPHPSPSLDGLVQIRTQGGSGGSVEPPF